MASFTLLRAAGLQTAHNPFSGTTPGALGIAKNVCIFSNGVLEPRRGHKNLSYTASGTTTAGGFFGDTLVVQHGTSLSYDTGSAFTAFSGSYSPADDTLLRMKFVAAKGNLYFNTDAGVYCLETASGTPRKAGLPRPNIAADDGSYSGGGVIPYLEQTSIRAVYTYTDANGNVLTSAPSQRFVITGGEIVGNSVDILERVPATLPSGTKLRVYATDLVDTDGAGGAVPEDMTDDEMFVTYEAESSASLHVIGNIFLGDEALYTNARQDGILAANTPPPQCRDLAFWQSRMWCANTASPHRFQLSMLGVGAPDGYQTSDTLTINGTAFSTTAYSAASASENIRETTRALVAAINANTALGVTAYQIYSGGDSGYGDFVLESTSVGGSAFTVYASRAASWNPELPTTSATALTSDNNRLPHGLFYSKPDQPEAVPLLNYLLIGAKNAEILRIVPLREKLFVFKEDGIYTVSGDEPFRVDLLDEKTRLVSPDTAVVLNNQIFCLTNQGVCAVSEVGVQIVSRAIEDQLHPFLTAAQRATIKRYSFGVAHETDRTYELHLPGPGVSTSSQTNTTYVYNVITQTWTTWEGTEKTWGAVSPTDVRYYGGASGTVYKERRDHASSDYADETFSITVNAFNGTTLTLASTSGLAVGDAITISKNGSSQTETVTAIAGNDVTVSAAFLTAFQSGGTAIAEKAFECDVRWLPQANDRPASLKHFVQGVFHFARPTAFDLGYATYATESSPATESDALVSLTTGFGAGAWGSSAWGDPARNLNMRHTIPTEKQYASMLYPGFRIREAGAGWRLLGMTLGFEEVGEWGTR